VFNKRNQRVSAARLGACNVAAIIKVAARKLGLDPIAFAGHSLRAGFVTSAVKRGANLIKITDVTGQDFQLTQAALDRTCIMMPSDANPTLPHQPASRRANVVPLGGRMRKIISTILATALLLGGLWPVLAILHTRRQWQAPNIAVLGRPIHGRPGWRLALGRLA
jgi:hypothetical protein